MCVCFFLFWFLLLSSDNWQTLSIFVVSGVGGLGKTTGQKMLSTTESTRENIRAINEYWIVPASHKHAGTHKLVLFVGLCLWWWWRRCISVCLCIAMCERIYYYYSTLFLSLFIYYGRLQLCGSCCTICNRSSLEVH